MQCPQEPRGVAACAWAARFEQAQNELLLAKYEAKKWKEKYLQEKRRRRKLARSLLDTMAMMGDTKRAASRSPPVRRSSSSRARTRRSSSAFSDRDQIENLLSPTLSSFDFDDDYDDKNDEDDGVEDGASDGLSIADIKGDASSSADEQEDDDEDTVPQLGTTNGHIATNGEQALVRQDVRPTRSSTVGSCDVFRVARSNSWRRDANATLPPANLLYRMLYTKSSSRDLWATQSSRLQSVAKSVVFSMQLKKEHVFEHFFVTGMNVGEAEMDQARRSLDGLVGLWKPQVLYEFAKRPGQMPDASVADFCFPSGVPVARCKPHQAATLRGSPVSIWSTDAEQLQRHALDPFKTSGYTFRLTGAKGEVLHGFCVAIMDELIESPTPSDALTSPRGEWVKRASCPSASALRLSESTGDSASASFHKRQLPEERPRSASATEYLAPVCYCFTSKFPFYRLHFMLIRQIIENELRARDTVSGSCEPDLYDVALTVESELGIEFAVCRQPNVKLADQTTGSVQHGPRTLSSVSSGVHRDKSGAFSLSEELPIGTSSHPDPHKLDDRVRSPPRQGSTLRKSYSESDLASYKSPASCVVERPVVVRTSSVKSPRLSKTIQVGDVLESIDGVSTASLSFTEAMELIVSTPRPYRLRFRRLDSARRRPITPGSPSTGFQLSAASTDLLQRVRRLRIAEPGQWSPLRLPEHVLHYQFPKRDAERWSIGVVLRALSVESIVKILTHLLLERQVVIMGHNSAMVTAVCTGFLLLLAPFQWQSTYIPQLPSSLLDFLHSPVPFIVGCQSLESTEDWSEVCFFNVDTNVILTPISDHHINQTFIPHGAEFSRLFHGAAQRLSRLRATSKPWYELSEEEDKIITLTMQESQIFLQDICSDLTSSLSLSPVQGKSFYERLQEEMTTIIRKSHFEDFLEELSQTQLFFQYCESVLQPERDAFTKTSAKTRTPS